MTSYKPQVLAICSGKGGVGKTTLAVNMGIALSRLGLRVCLLDADTNLANVNIMLREAPAYTLQHVLSGEKTLKDILLSAHGISFIPAASGVTDFAELKTDQQKRLISTVLELEQRYDVILVDTSAGVHESVLSFIESAQQSLVVITPEPTSLTDSFSLLRMLQKRKYQKRINVVVNQAESELGARQVFKRFSSAVNKYIGYHTAYLGHVIKDELVSSAVCSQVPVRVYRPTAKASRCYDQLAGHLRELLDNQQSEQGLSDNFSQHLRQAPESPLAVTETSPVVTPGEIDTTSTQAPQKEDVEAQRAVYQQADRTRKKQLLHEHRLSLLEYIEDAEQSKKDIQDVMTSLIAAYQKRFKEFPLNPVEQLEGMLKNNTLGQQGINQLYTQLMLFYKEKRIQLDRDTAAELLNQQMSDYVDEYAHYPFDVSQALMQSIGFGQLSDEAIAELDGILSVVGESAQANQLQQSQPRVQAAAIKYSQPASNELNKMKDTRTALQGLRDGIRFASKLDK